MINIDYKPGFTLISKGKEFNLKQININKHEKSITGVLTNWSKDDYIANSFRLERVKKHGKEEWKFELENNEVLLKHINLALLIRQTLVDTGHRINF